jgi:hypothetical protein
MSFTNPIDIGTPLGSESLSQGDERIREVKSGVQELLAVDHETTLTGSEINSVDSGCHNKITLLEQISDPLAPVGVDDYGLVYTKLDVNTSQSELFWKDEGSNVLQLTIEGSLLLADSLLPNNVYIKARNAADDTDVAVIKLDANDQVLLRHSATEPARLGTNDPPLADADIANKKYVDDREQGFGTMVLLATKTNSVTVGTPNVDVGTTEATEDGMFICVASRSNDQDFAGLLSTGYSDTTAVSSTAVGYAVVDATYNFMRHASYSFPVKKGDYYSAISTNPYSSGTVNNVTRKYYWVPMNEIAV